MKWSALAVVAVAALLLTGLATKGAGRAPAREVAEAELDPLKTPAGRLFVRGGARHWRNCLLQQ